jgi:hypothetical protein
MTQRQLEDFGISSLTRSKAATKNEDVISIGNVEGTVVEVVIDVDDDAVVDESLKRKQSNGKKSTVKAKAGSQAKKGKSPRHPSAAAARNDTPVTDNWSFLGSEVNI